MSPSDETWATLVDLDPSATIRPDPARPLNEAVQALFAMRRANDSLEFGEVIGTGGMGLVRVANQPRMGRPVAVKSLRSAGQEDAAHRLIEEAWVTGCLEHPNIVPIYDIALDDDQGAHILMKRITGTQWGALMDSAEAAKDHLGGSDLLAWNLRILATVCNAIHFAHSRGILHRDLKPDNVMIGEFGEVYVLDWGIAARLDSPDATKRIAGTPRYMPPEMAKGQSAGAATDVYLLGGLLHRILTGQAPHRGWSIPEILGNIPSFKPTFEPDTPPELARLVQQAMVADPHARLASADGFRQGILTFLERRSSIRLTAEAERARRSLETELADEQDRTSLYRHLATCQLGFQEALRTWPENPVAKQGWVQVHHQMVDYEIRARDPRAARSLLISLDSPAPELEARVAALEEEREEEDRALRHLALDQDLKIGARTRVFFAAVLGIAWSLTAAGSHWILGTPSFELQLAFTAGTTFAVAAFVYWGRESLLATILNRATAGMMLITPVCQVLMQTLLHLNGVDPAVALGLQNFLFSVTTLCASVLLDKRLLVSFVAFFTAALFSAFDPERSLLYMSASTVLFTANLLGIWWPSMPASPTHRPDV